MSKEYTSFDLSKRLGSIELDMRPAYLHLDGKKTVNGYTAQQGFKWLHEHKDQFKEAIVAIKPEGTVVISEDWMGMNAFVPYEGNLADMIWETILYIERTRISER